MANQSYQGSRDCFKKIKSAEKLIAPKRTFVYPSIIETLNHNDHPIIPLPSYVSPTKNITALNKLIEKKKEKEGKKVEGDREGRKGLKTTKSSFFEWEKKNMGLTVDEVGSGKSERKGEQLGKSCQNLLRREQKLIKNIKHPQKKQQLNPEILTIKNYSQTISTNTSSQRCQKRLQLEDFQIGRKIGTGKYGSVFIIRHKKSKTMYALKKISKVSISEQVKNQLIYQIKIQTFLDHPNVVKLYAFFSDQEHIYLVMELCTSGHLFDLLKSIKTFPQTATKVIVKQLCQGMDHLHHHEIIHRDLKLENILYHFGMIKICDFGWSTICSSFRDTFCGTPLYISPELLQNKSYGNKVDIWSIGILAYEMLFGKVPFEIKHHSDFCKILQDQLVIPEEPLISKEAKQFLKGCLYKKPELRMQIEELIGHLFLQNCEALNCLYLY